MSEIKHYSLGDNGYILGLNPKDAIEHNIQRLATEKPQGFKPSGFNLATTALPAPVIIIHPTDEIYAYYKEGILGGVGGIEIVMRGKASTYVAWMYCPEEEWTYDTLRIVPTLSREV